MDLLPLALGAYSLVFMDENTLYAARDPQGVRPLVLGRLDRGWVVASETPASRATSWRVAGAWRVGADASAAMVPSDSVARGERLDGTPGAAACSGRSARFAA
jgi:asparagine synthetase B (glutamine-hydrolysing)